MDKETKEQIKKQLEQRKTDLEKELAKISDADGDASYEDVGDSEGENAQEVTQYTNNLALVAELQKSLDDVKSALNKIDSEGYGICKYCKNEINPKRLLARPASGSCVSCKATLQGE